MKYWFVEFYAKGNDPKDDCPDHNDVVSGFDEFCALSQGCIGIVTGAATEEDYAEQQRQKNA